MISSALSTAWLAWKLWQSCDVITVPSMQTVFVDFFGSAQPFSIYFGTDWIEIISEMKREKLTRIQFLMDQSTFGNSRISFQPESLNEETIRMESNKLGSDETWSNLLMKVIQKTLPFQHQTFESLAFDAFICLGHGWHRGRDCASNTAVTGSDLGTPKFFITHFR